MKHLGLLLLLTPLTLAALTANSRTAEEFAPSQDLTALLMALGSDARPLLSAEERQYFEELPARAKQLFDDAVANELLSEAEHLKGILSLALSPAKLELLMKDNCIVCHTDPSAQDPETLFSADPESFGSPSHLDLREFVNDVHFRRELSCAGCHGGDPNDDVMADEIYDRWPEAPERQQDRTWVPSFCASCHSDPDFMRRFDPAAATDQYAKYEQSRHGERLLREADSKAAQCVSCHTAHAILGPRSPRSSVYPQRIPYTCGGCHADADYMRGYLGSNGKPLPTDQLAEFETSVHGRALIDRGDLGAPACNDCHGNHAAIPPEITSITQVCRTCHAAIGELFDGSNHREAFERHGWPECETCHGNHAIDDANDSMLSEASSPLCYECHREYAADDATCVETARYFYATITFLGRETDRMGDLIQPLAQKGLDVDALTETVGELGDILRRSRLLIHAFDRGEFVLLETRGRKQVETGQALVVAAEAEYRFRRNGLLVAVGIMVFLAAAVYLKIREIESDS